MKTIPAKRIFLGLDLTRELKNKLALYEWELTKQDLPFRFEDEKKLHLTLLFLGNTNTEQLNLIKSLLKPIIGQFTTFILGITKLEAFPGFNHPKILYLSLNGQLDKLFALQEELRQVLKGKGFRPQNKDKFIPHITIGKFVNPPYPIHVKNMGQKLAGLKIKPPQESFLIKEVVLFESKLSQEGSTYKILKKWQLINGA
ncbi:RNA 2',3'-cyclic phosphodiesterase [Candidatus Microgenomates bacterium]|nr:RNA 2',3'-cyclic phosphodiesterase [Candidatus Microgenomates bacterium]